ncbi:hypothetical protein ACFQ4C_08600 [Larkinella insperata]|uniref:Uncharacterized protein n=1 Tax=Larkinella insperata TaxID=332158 RepID=A0ABW3Q8U3_9BACT
MKQKYLSHFATGLSGWRWLCFLITMLGASSVSLHLRAQSYPISTQEESNKAVSVHYQLRPAISAQTDSQFAELSGFKMPSYSEDVARKDSLRFARGYRLANRSVSKQVTTYSIVPLAKAEKLLLDDDIRAHLPWFPDLKRKISIRHSLNPIRGVYDEPEMFLFGGFKYGPFHSQQRGFNTAKT